jgi:hypothetical protein
MERQGDQAANEDANPSEDQETEHATLGRTVHTFLGRPPIARSPRSLLMLGVVSAVMVPIGIRYVTGTMGTVIAVLGALIAIGCYFTSGARAHAPGIDIRIFDRGISCSQGSAARELMWNEIVEVTARRIKLPSGKSSLALAFEVVGEKPLLIIVGAPFSDAERTRQLVDSLSDAWLAVWCRRARVLLQAERDLNVGQASLTLDGAKIGSRHLDWSSILGVIDSEATVRLETDKGAIDVEPSTGNLPFPSAARRLSTLAQSGPIRPILPPG